MVSASLFVGFCVSFGTLSIDKQKFNGFKSHLMCIGSNVKDKLIAFQLESLILAQNERWRQASYMQVERSFGTAANGLVTRGNVPFSTE